MIPKPEQSGLQALVKAVGEAVGPGGGKAAQGATQVRPAATLVLAIVHELSRSEQEALYGLSVLPCRFTAANAALVSPTSQHPSTVWQRTPWDARWTSGMRRS